LAGLVTYLLLILYFDQQFGERPSIRRLRELRRHIRSETAIGDRLDHPIEGEQQFCLWTCLLFFHLQAKS
jgi:hypothetical protein